jgi:AraC-like DNA-binding protein
MKDFNSSKVYKIKIYDMTVTVTADSSYLSSNGAEKAPYFADWHHYHAVHELFIVGNEPILINTESGTAEYKECALCIPPFFNHKAIRDQDYRLLFSIAESGVLSSEFAELAIRISSATEPLALRINDSVLLYAKELSRVLSSGALLSDEMAVSLLKLIFCNIYQESIEVKRGGFSKSEESYLVAIERILVNYQDDISLGAVAEKLGLSTRQASRIIMKHYKTSLSNLVTERRLNVARLMLLSGRFSVSEIVERVNFTSESYFYSQFKKVYGCTPLQYKKTYSAGKEKL